MQIFYFSIFSFFHHTRKRQNGYIWFVKKDAGTLFISRNVSVLIFANLLLAILLPPVSQAGFFGPSANTKKVVAQIKQLSVSEAKLLARWNSVIGKNYTDDYTTGMALIKLLPDVNTFISKLDALAPEDAKLRSGINLWISGWNKQAEGITLAIAAIDGQDYAMMAKANAATSAGRALLKKSTVILLPFLK